jgi:hypothetical protein
VAFAFVLTGMLSCGARLFEHPSWMPSVTKGSGLPCPVGAWPTPNCHVCFSLSCDSPRQLSMDFFQGEGTLSKMAKESRKLVTVSDGELRETVEPRVRALRQR